MSLIQTNYGQIRGTSRTTDDGKVYDAFFAIPYAKQPLGELRFRDPQPLKPWKGELDATKQGDPAFQKVWFNPTNDPKLVTAGSDNCLILNVYVPKTNEQAKLPVFVWIHGGGFFAGSSGIERHGPDYFVEKDIIVVTINYRLGVVGFLSFKDETLGIPGNAGLKDQSMALRWVKENIAHFGGDPENITLGGESAGGASVHYQMISPMSKNLFNRAIVQSGSAFNPWASTSVNDNYEYELARKLGWNGEGGDKGAFDVISSTEITKLLLASEVIENKAKGLFNGVAKIPFVPKVEPYKSNLCFLPKSIVELGREAWSNEIDVIIGANKDEGLLFESQFKECTELLKNDFKLLIPYQLRETLNIAEQTAAASILKNIYFWKRDVDFKFANKFIEIIGDNTFWHGIHRQLLQRHFLATGKTYHYLLATSSDPQLGFYKMVRQICSVTHDNGTCHGDDLPLIWKTIFSPKPSPQNKIYPTFVKYFDAYASFIKTGNPNNPSLGVKWKTIGERESEEEMFTTLKFTDDGVALVPSPFGERLLVWDSIYEQTDLM